MANPILDRLADIWGAVALDGQLAVCGLRKLAIQEFQFSACVFPLLAEADCQETAIRS